MLVDNKSKGGISMHISNKPVHRMTRVYEQQAKIGRKQKSNDSTSEQDIVTLSDEGKELQAVLHKVYVPQEPSANAVRIKEALSSGNYHRSGQEIAASMLKYFNQKV